MKRKLTAILCLLALAISMAGCQQEAAEEETTTLTGIVMSVDGTVITLLEMGTGSRGQGSFERFDGTLPEGETMPSIPEDRFEGFDGTMPEGGFERFDGTLPEGETMPSIPEDRFEGFDGTMPEGGFGGRGNGFGGRGDFGNVEGTQVDLANAHITVEFDGGKATGSMEDITVGSYVTVTLNSKGEATNIVVSENTGFGGRGNGFGGGQGGFGGGRGNFGGGQGGFGRMPGDAQQSTEPTG